MCTVFCYCYWWFLIVSKYYSSKVYADSKIVADRYQAIVEAQNSKENTIDALVVGDSICNAGVSPFDMWNEKGFTSYTYASFGQVIEESYYNLKDIFKKQSPKVVLLESNIIFKDKGYVGNAQDMVNETQNNYVPAIKFHDIWKKLLSNEKNKKTFYKGFDMRDKVTYSENRDYMKETKKIAKVSKNNKIFLDNIEKLCRENNCKLCLLALPRQAKAFGSSAKKYEEYNYLNKYAKEKGLDVIDLNIMCMEKKLDIDWTKQCSDSQEDVKYNDGLGEHLNTLGASIVSKTLAKELSDRYDLKDHKKDEKYKEWVNDYEEYKDLKSKTIKKMKQQ